MLTTNFGYDALHCRRRLDINFRDKTLLPAMAYTYPPSEPIAIIGSGCRFPGKTTSPSKLWDLLTNPTDLSKKTPLDRFDVDGFYNTDGEHHGTTNATSSYWLEEDHRMFDAAFFNITPKEAEVHLIYS